MTYPAQPLADGRQTRGMIVLLLWDDSITIICSRNAITLVLVRSVRRVYIGSIRRTNNNAIAVPAMVIGPSIAVPAMVIGPSIAADLIPVSIAVSVPVYYRATYRRMSLPSAVVVLLFPYVVTVSAIVIVMVSIAPVSTAVSIPAIIPIYPSAQPDLLPP